MARRSETFHVKDADGTLHEVAVFSDTGDIPSPSSYAEVRANGSLAYIAATAQTMLGAIDQTYLEAENGTGLYLRGYSGGNDYRVLEDPYYIHPLMDPVEFAAEAGSFSAFGGSNYHLMTDILSTNGSYSSCSTSKSGFTIADSGMTIIGQEPIYGAYISTANTSSDDITFSVDVTYKFADGSTKTRTLNCVQLASTDVTLTINATPSNATIDISYSTISGVVATSQGTGSLSCTVPSGTKVNYTVSCDGYDTVTGSTTVTSNSTINVILTQTAYLTLGSSSLSFHGTSSSSSVSVSSNVAWSASSDSSWLTVSPSSGSGNGTLTVSVSANSSTSSSRTGTITVRTTDGSGLTATVSVAQLMTVNGVYILYRSGSSNHVVPYGSWSSSLGTANGVLVSDGTNEVLVAPDEATSKVWGVYGSTVSGVTTSTSSTTAKEDYNGRSNTDALISEGYTSTSYASGYCNSYSNGYIYAGAWHLPALGELALIAANYTAVNSALSAIGGTALGGGGSYYWSSTQYNAYIAWCGLLYTGNLTSQSKSTSSRVRPVSTTYSYGV